MNTPWIEKYRPNNLNNISSHEQIIKTLRNFIKSEDMPHLLFYGPAGTGKTSTIISCANELYKDDFEVMVLQINVSEERGIEAVRNLIHPFVKSRSLLFSERKLFKLVILDEADAMTNDAQAMLRRIIEKYTENARFCLICNYIKKINIALQSRCTVFRFASIPSDIIRNKIDLICSGEEITISEDAIGSIIERSGGDMRKVINILQATSMRKKDITDDDINITLGYPTTDEVKIIFKSLLKDSYYKCFKKIRKIKFEKGYRLNDILECISKKIIDDDEYMTKHKNICDLIINIAKIEYNLINNVVDDIQLAAFIGLFKK